MSRSVLVVAAHPDDEVLGCGGTMARHAAEGDTVNVAIVAEGITSRGGAGAADGLAELAAAARAANAILGVAAVRLLGLPDNRLDGMDRLDLVQRVEALVAEFRPDIIYTHHAGDLNVDHRRVHEAVVTAARPLPGCAVTTLLFFEVASSTEWQPPGSAVPFVPSWFVDISAELERKEAALRAYSGEMRPWPHARSVQAVSHLARWRGASAGMEAAEAFMLGRHLRRPVGNEGVGKGEKS